MSVINVLDTQTISASGTGYVTVKSGVLRVYSASASSIQVDGGPAITLAAATPELISCGKAKSATIEAATDANPTVLTITGGAGQRHNFAANDYISTANGGDTAFVAAFVSAASGGKKVASITDSTITTDLDASGASADYALATAKISAGTRPVVQRAIKLTAGSADVIVEQVQVVGG